MTTKCCWQGLSVTTDQIQLKNFQSHLTKAGKLQQMLMPKSDPQVDGYDIAGKSIPCDETGGDYFDFINQF
jgi:serine phosphatase RsbU (regulator of sigma subunit)